MNYSLTADYIDDQSLADIRQSYKQEGYCLVDNVYSVAELDEMESFFEDFKNQEHKAFGNAISTDEGWGENYTFRFDDIDPSKELLRAMHPHRFSRQVQQWYLHSRIGLILAALLGCPALGGRRCTIINRLNRWGKTCLRTISTCCRNRPPALQHEH